MRLKLDDQYKYLHINFGEEEYNIKYDSLNTVRNFCILDKKVGIWGIFKNVLEENDLEIDPFVNIVEDPKISWMDYRSNYLIKKDYTDIDDDDDDEIIMASLKDDEIGDSMPRFIPFGMGMQDEYKITPWGKFLESDPMNPMNLYDEIHVMHCRGFNLEDLLRLEATMNSIRGITRWTIIDKYSIIICISKTYSASEVKFNVEETIYNNLNCKKISKFEESAIIGQGESEKNKTDHLLLIFPNGEKQLIENPTAQDINDVDNILSNMKNCIVFKNGALYEGGESDK